MAAVSLQETFVRLSESEGRTSQSWLDGLLASLGIAGQAGPVLRALDKLAKIGRDRVLAELTQAQARLTDDQARRVLDFVEGGRGGVEVLAATEAVLGEHPQAAEGIASLRGIFDLLDAAGIPRDRLAIDLGLARGL